jgi:N-sulfoglucosamine sulfohydrolase
MKFLFFSLLIITCTAETKRPNILFCIADDWGAPHASIYGNDPVVATPSFDRIAKEGALFHNAYVSSPSCTPCRNSIMTGQWHWRLKGGANLYGTLPQEVETYSRLLQQAGYHTGSWRKSFGPGQLEGKFLKEHPAGKVYRKGFEEFLGARPDKDTPFCFWLGASDPHRGYRKGSGKNSGMDLSKIKIFPFFPDTDEVRSDVADYYFEVQRFDSDVAKAIAQLEKIGELDSTIIVVTGDHGMPFPRCKSNLYDSGTRVPLAIRWGDKIKPGQAFKDFVSLIDLAPTFLQAAGLSPPKEMTGKNLLPAIAGDASLRKHIITGKERHVPSQEAPSMEGYPSRSYRDHEYLYIRNYLPTLWPNGTPLWQKATIKNTWYGDTDNGPTKTVIVDLGSESKFYQWSFAKRPANELYDLSKDPHQLVNIAEAKPDLTKKYASLLTGELKTSFDPRHGGPAFDFAVSTYGGGGPRYPKQR